VDLRQTAYEQVDIVDIAVDTMKGLLQDRIRGQLREGMVWWKPERLACLVEGVNADIPRRMSIAMRSISSIPPPTSAANSRLRSADAAQPVFICLAEVSLKKYCRGQTWLSG
jgi:hypothetical protein